jgi:hypothetical protein
MPFSARLRFAWRMQRLLVPGLRRSMPSSKRLSLSSAHIRFGLTSAAGARWFLLGRLPPITPATLALPPGQTLGKKHPVQESPPHGFRPLKEGLCRLLAEPTPSPRLCISAWARPLADQVRVSCRRKVHGQKRNFSFCTKPELLTLR